MRLPSAGTTQPRSRTGIQEISPLDELIDESSDLAEIRQALVAYSEQVGGLGSWAWDLETGNLVWSDNAFRLAGLEPSDVVPTPEYLMSVTHPDDRPLMARILEMTSAGGPVQPEVYRLVRPDGEIRHLETSVTFHPRLAGRRMAVGIVRDVTARVDAEREIAALLAVTTALGEWTDFKSGSMGLLRRMAGVFGFSRGVLWVPAGDILQARVLWGYKEAPECSHGMPTFVLQQGEGLAGRAWVERRPVSVFSARDDPEYAFQESAERSELRGATAIPLLADGEVLGVIGLAGQEELKLTERLTATLLGIGHEVGAFLARRLGELAPPSLTPRELEVLQLAAEGFSNREMAERMYLSPATVKRHLEHIYAKYEVDGRAAAVAKAVREGLIT